MTKKEIKTEYAEFKKRLRKTRVWTLEEAKTELEKPMPLRERAIGCLLYVTGCRIGELIQIKRHDLSFDTRIVEGKKTKLFLVKVNTEKNPRQTQRILPLIYEKHKWAILPVLKYAHGFEEKDTLFPYSQRHIRRLVWKWWDFNPHHFRHIRLTHLKRYFRMEEQRFQMFAGWADPRSARVYSHLNWGDMIV